MHTRTQGSCVYTLTVYADSHVFCVLASLGRMTSFLILYSRGSKKRCCSFFCSRQSFISLLTSAWAAMQTPRKKSHCFTHVYGSKRRRDFGCRWYCFSSSFCGVASPTLVASLSSLFSTREKVRSLMLGLTLVLHGLPGKKPNRYNQTPDPVRHTTKILPLRALLLPQSFAVSQRSKKSPSVLSTNTRLRYTNLETSSKANRGCQSYLQKVPPVSVVTFFHRWESGLVDPN